MGVQEEPKIWILLKWMRLAKDIFSSAEYWFESQFTTRGFLSTAKIVWNHQ